MVRAVAVMPDGHRVVSAGTDGTIRVWDIETGQNLAVVGGRLGHVQALVTLPDNRSIVSGDYDRVCGWVCCVLVVVDGLCGGRGRQAFTLTYLPLPNAHACMHACHST